MKFSPLELTASARSLLDEVQNIIDTYLTPQYRAREKLARDDHDPDFYRALGQRGWIMPRWPQERGGAGLSAVEEEILVSELAKADAPRTNLSTSRTVIPALATYGGTALQTEVLGPATAGEIAIALGYSEPEGGSDIAAARTRATRVGDQWTINGTKVFTTGAHHCAYTFLLTRTDPDARKHAGLTLFLLPMDSRGIEIHPLYTLGERTNTVYLSDVRVPDRYRVGDVNEGWKVLVGPLDAEHGLGEDGGVSPYDFGLHRARRLALAVDAAVEWGYTADTTGRMPIEDPHVRRRLARAVVNVHIAAAASGLHGRVSAADLFVSTTSDLVDLMGPEAVAPETTYGDTIADWHQRSQVATVYGGTVEVFRNMIADQIGLPRPQYGNRQ
jgi:alkylation response protein AidB-like acyl-CoA dehydrogenase